MNRWTVRREVESDGTWTLTALDANESSRGSLRVRPDTGTVRLRSWYRLGLSLHGAPEVHVQRLAPTLTLCSDLNAFHEISELASDDAAVTTLLLQAVRLWLARETAHVRAYVELRGTSSASSSIASAFFREVSRHFLPPDASSMHAELSRGCWPSALAGLLPRHPIYLDLLPDEVRSELQLRPHAAPHLLQALQANGLMSGQFANVVDGAGVACGTLALTELTQYASWREDASLPASSQPEHTPIAGSLSLDGTGNIAHLAR